MDYSPGGRSDRTALCIRAVAGPAHGLYLRFLRDCDELERRIESGALAWAAGITMLSLMTALFLLDAGLLEMTAKLAIAALAFVLFGSYALVRAVLHRRYA